MSWSVGGAVKGWVEIQHKLAKHVLLYRSHTHTTTTHSRALSHSNPFLTGSQKSKQIRGSYMHNVHRWFTLHTLYLRVRSSGLSLLSSRIIRAA